MRLIELEDLNRVLLTALEHTVPEDPWSPGRSSLPPIESGLRLLIDDTTRNTVVARFLGSLSYRSRERIVRLLDRLTGWHEGEDAQRLDLLRYWSDQVAAEFLTRREVFYVKSARFEEWRRQMHALDEDLPVLAWLVRQRPGDIQSAADLERELEFWPTFLRGDDPQLYREVERGVACLHLHLSGAYPAPYFWVGLMNYRFDEAELERVEGQEAVLRGYRDPDVVKQVVEWIRVARQVRWRLFEFVRSSGAFSALGENGPAYRRLGARPEADAVRREVEKLRKRSPLDVVHLLGSVADRSICPSLFGERYLQYVVLRAVAASSGTAHGRVLARLYWSYAVAKNAFLTLVQQAEGIAGFDYFEHTFRMLRWNGDSQRDLCCQEIGRFLQESRAVVKLELMVAPQDDVGGYARLVKDAELVQSELRQRLGPVAFQSYGDPRVGLVVHFIKDHGEPLSERDRDGAYLVYHHGCRDRSLQQLDVLADHMDAPAAADSPPIVAIDTANRELYCPPEVFAEVYERATRQLRRQDSRGRRVPIARTYHVGEDFVNLMTGLRRIFEAVEFLALQPGDRLGHACALGFDPERWVYSNPSVEMHRIDLLDDAVFERFVLKSGMAGGEGSVWTARLNELERAIEEHSIEIFGEAVPPGVLERAWLARGSIRRGAHAHGDVESIPAWVREQGARMAGLSGAVGSHSAVPNAQWLAGAEVGAHVEPRNTVERVLIEYLHDKATVRRFLNLSSKDVSQDAVHLVRVQAALRKLLMQKGIVIESNPTSNWLIGGLERHTDVPAVEWLLHHPDVAVTIQPDDPTVFSTSIENEYFFVHAAMVHGAAQPIARGESLARIARARLRGLDASFLE